MIPLALQCYKMVSWCVLLIIPILFQCVIYIYMWPFWSVKLLALAPSKSVQCGLCSIAPIPKSSSWTTFGNFEGNFNIHHCRNTIQMSLKSTPQFGLKCRFEIMRFQTRLQCKSRLCPHYNNCHAAVHLATLLHKIAPNPMFFLSAQSTLLWNETEAIRLFVLCWDCIAQLCYCKRAPNKVNIGLF